MEKQFGKLKKGDLIYLVAPDATFSIYEIDYIEVSYAGWYFYLNHVSGCNLFRFIFVSDLALKCKQDTWMFWDVFCSENDFVRVLSNAINEKV